MKRLEKRFENKVRDILKEVPKSYWFMKTAGSSIRGTPDVLGIVNGRFIALELKRTRKLSEVRTKTTELQKYKLRLLKDVGAYSSFVYPENLDKILSDIRGFCE
jgi:penicillin-binding protein-related factor A (putative recombinase)